jgi:Core-2/I-Branching enzyme
MKLGFILLVHRDPEQVARLVDRLDDPDSTFVVHVGRARPDAYEPIVALLDGRPNVHFLPRRRIHWGGWGISSAFLDGLDALAELAPDAEFVSNLSGQDYPLKPKDALRAHLAAHEGRSFLDHFRIPVADGEGSLDWSLQRGGLDRIEFWHFHAYRRHARFPGKFVPLPRGPRRLPAGLEPYGGQAWWTLSREAVAYIRRFLRERPDVVRFFRFADVAEELMFQTVLLSSPLRDSVVGDDLRYIVWKPGVSHPELLTSADLPALEASGDFFGRKFDAAADPEVLDEIDRRLLGAPVAP